MSIVAFLTGILEDPDTGNRDRRAAIRLLARVPVESRAEVMPILNSTCSDQDAPKSVLREAGRSRALLDILMDHDFTADDLALADFAGEAFKEYDRTIARDQRRKRQAWREV